MSLKFHAVHVLRRGPQSCLNSAQPFNSGALTFTVRVVRSSRLQIPLNPSQAPIDLLCALIALAQLTTSPTPLHYPPWLLAGLRQNWMSRSQEHFLETSNL